MSFAAFVGFAMMILITTLLLKKKVSTLFAFTIIPIIGAFLLGANVKEVCDYVKFGLGKTRDLMFIIFFSLPYFSLMNEVGLFDTMVEFLLKRTKLSVTIVMITHDNSIAVQADRIIRLEDGQVVYDGDSRAPEAIVQPTLNFETAEQEGNK